MLCSTEDAVREMLCDFSTARGLPEVGTVTAEDQLDDGSTIRLAITIDRWASGGYVSVGTGRSLQGPTWQVVILLPARALRHS